MRVFAALTAMALVSGCATQPVGPAPTREIAPQTVSNATPEGPSRAALLARYLSLAGSADAPGEDDVMRALGAADVTRRDGAGLALTYRLDTCALVLLFASQDGGAVRLAQTYPGPRRTGAPAPDLETCAGEALARGAPGAP